MFNDRNKIITLSALAGLALWVIDAFVDSLVFSHSSFWDSLILHPSAHEIYFRSLYLAGAILFGIVVSRAMGKMREAARKTEDEKAKSEAIISAIGDGISIQDTGFRVIYQNETHKKLVGEHTGEYCYEAYSCRDQVCEGCPVAKAFNDGNIHTLEKVVPRETGNMHIEIKASPLRDSSGKIIAGIEAVRDITRRKQAEEQIRKSEERMSLAQSIAHVGDWKWDIATNAVQWSDELYRIYGFRPEEIVPDYALVLRQMHPKSKDAFMRAIDAALKDNMPFEMDYLFFRKDGSEATLHTVGNVIRDPGGAPLQMVGIVQDITEIKRADEKIQLFSRAVEEAMDGIQIVDLNGNILYSNKAVEDIYGFSSEELLGRHVNSLNADKEFAGRVILPSIRENGWWNGELMVIHKTGREFPVWLSTSLVRDNNGEPVAMIGIIRDMTERTLLEQSLLEQKKLAENLLENSAIPTFVLSPEHKVLIWNKACENLTGIRSSDIIGTDNHWQAFYPQKRKTLADVVIDGNYNVLSSLYSKHTRSQLISNGLQAEDWYENLNGKKRYIAFDAAPVYSISGELLVVIETLQDITKRKEAEEGLGRHRANLEELVILRTAELSAINEKLRLEIMERENAEQEIESYKNKIETLINSSNDIIILKDRNFRLLVANRALEKTFGVAAKDIIGKTDFDYMPEETAKGCRKSDEATLGSEGPVETEEWIGHRCFNSVKQRVRDEKGNIIGIAAIIRDVTDKRKMEEELLKAQKLESLGILAGGLAHDFNNLLTGIFGNISLAKMYSSPDSKVHARLEKAEKASLRAQDLTRQLLTFSKGGMPVKKAMSLSELVRESASFALRGSSCSCEFHIPADLWPVEIDEGQISQVINNLIINAEQAMPDGGTITVECSNIDINAHLIIENIGEYVKISVRDHGIGISREHLPKIFDPFFTTKQKGSGLGLSSTYSIIKKHGGYITVESELGRGTTFFLYLPATHKTASTAMPENEEYRKGKGRVLIMDDDEIIRETTSEILSEIGYEAAFVKDGTEAIAAYKNAMGSGRPFDAVIMDLTIPGGMGGKETIKSLREIDPDVRAIVSSGYSNDPIMSSYSQYGFVGVIIKPFKIKDISETLYRVVNA